MEYFVMLPDPQLDCYRKLDFHSKEFEQREPFVIHMDFDEHEEFPDFFFGKNVFDYRFCVSDRMKELMEAYNSKLEAVPFFITDYKFRDQRVYWQIYPAEIDCFTVPLYPDEQKLSWREEVKDLPFFFVAPQVKAKYLIVSLELAENILRRQMFGIQFVRIQKGVGHE